MKATMKGKDPFSMGHLFTKSPPFSVPHMGLALVEWAETFSDFVKPFKLLKEVPGSQYVCVVDAHDYPVIDAWCTGERAAAGEFLLDLANARYL